jgi:ERCC4-type nuclease
MTPAPSRTAALVAHLRGQVEPAIWKPGDFGLTIDTREQKPIKVCNSIPVTVATLQTGDVSVTGMEQLFTVDRKSLDDFAQCITRHRDGRFARLLERMSAMDFAAFVVEASLEDVHRRRYRTQVEPSTILSTAASITIKYGVPVYFAGGAFEGHDLIVRFARAYWKINATEAA